MDERTELVGMNEFEVVDLPTENTGKNGLKKLGIIAGIVGGSVAIGLGIKTIINKTKDKRKAKKIAKADKILCENGWTTTPPLENDGIE